MTCCCVDRNVPNRRARQRAARPAKRHRENTHVRAGPADNALRRPGPRDQVEKLHAAWGMWAKPAANGQFDHPSRVFLVDDRGRVREVYNLDFFKPAWVLEDVQLLLEEADGGSEKRGDRAK